MRRALAANRLVNAVNALRKSRDAEVLVAGTKAMPGIGSSSEWEKTCMKIRTGTISKVGFNKWCGIQ